MWGALGPLMAEPRHRTMPRFNMRRGFGGGHSPKRSTDTT